MSKASNKNRAPWTRPTRDTKNVQPNASDYIGETEFRRFMAKNYTPGAVRGGMDKLKKILDRAIAAGGVAPDQRGEFKFGDLVGVVARSRSNDFKGHALSRPHTQVLNSASLHNKTTFKAPVVMPATATLSEATRIIAQLAQKICEAQAEISDLKVRIAEREVKRKRGLVYGQKGGRPQR